MSEFKVYWTHGGESHGETFQDVSRALDRCQELRNSGRRFVTMASEIDHMVGDWGVKETDSTYNWKKRRT